MDHEERAAFDDFARGRMRELLRFAHVLTGDADRAADLVQDALERTLMAWPRIERKDDPEGYVRRAIVNRHVSVWRRLRRERLVAETPDQPYDDAGGRDAELWAALATLPPRQRAVLVLRYYEDMSEADCAEVMGCSVGTVKSQAWKAIARLRARQHRPGGNPVMDRLEDELRDVLTHERRALSTDLVDLEKVYAGAARRRRRRTSVVAAAGASCSSPSRCRCRSGCSTASRAGPSRARRPTPHRYNPGNGKRDRPPPDDRCGDLPLGPALNGVRAPCP